jgi:hypothetical protein
MSLCFRREEMSCCLNDHVQLYTVGESEP